MSLTEVVWHGRGGQGAKTAGYILGEAAMEEGKTIQAFPEYGAERRGAPMKSYVRISDAPIRLRCAITNPEVVAVLDESLMRSIDVSEGMSEGGTLVVNSSDAPSELEQYVSADGISIYTVNATQIALDCFGRPIPNTPMLGALAKVTDLVSLQGAQESVRKKLAGKLAPAVLEGNMNAIERAYEEVQGA
ncbi:MAG: 2-oxoacid:acceptor oxidoreductase family protein [Armatimonadota bacterium]|jgi:pyruvate ferredoxin oxidoreductase gamma subunit